MIDPLHVKVCFQKIPMRDFISRDNGLWSDPFPCELDALRLPKKGSRHGSTAPLAEHDNHPALPAPIGATPPIDTLLLQIGRPDMTTERSAINLDLAVQKDAPGLRLHGFPQLVHEHKRRLVLHIQVT